MDMKEDIKQDLEQFKDFIKLTQDYVEHYKHFKDTCMGVKALDFILSISNHTVGSLLQICSTSKAGVRVMCEENKFPYLELNKEDIEPLLKADLPEALKERVKEIQKYVD